MSTTHRIFVYTPSRPGSAIREVEAVIEVKEKQTWAIVEKGVRGQKSFLLGATAFYTLPSANRAKRGALQKVIATPVLLHMAQTKHMAYEAQRHLDYFAQNGEFPFTKRLH